MRTKMIAAVALLTLLLGSGAFAQTQNSGAGQARFAGQQIGPHSNAIGNDLAGTQHHAAGHEWHQGAARQ